MSKEFKDEMARIKYEYGLNQGEIATRLGFHRTYLSGISSGKYPYSDTVKSRINEVFPRQTQQNVVQQNVEYHSDNSAEQWLPIVEELSKQVTLLAEQNRELIELLRNREG